MSFDAERLEQLQTQRKSLVAEQSTLVDSFETDESGTIVVDEGRQAEFQARMGEIKGLDGLIDGITGMMSPAQAEEAAGVAAEAAAVKSADWAREVKSLGEQFVNSDEFKALAGGTNGLTMPTAFEQKNDALDIYTAMPTGTPGEFGTIQRDPIVTLPQRKTRIRDLFPKATTSSTVIEYFRQTGFALAASAQSGPGGDRAGNNAAAVAERTGSGSAAVFGMKPQSALTFVGEQAPVRTLAHWAAAHRNVLSDEPQLRSIIDTELLYGLALHEDWQILQGTGSGEDLAGILNNGSIQSYAWSAGASTDNKADAIRRALTLAYMAQYEPTGVVVHPSDWEDMELTKDANGQYLLATSIAQGGVARVWQVPVIDTPAIPAGTALVGGFGLGAQIYDREGVSLRVAEQHEDFFTRNAVVVLAEKRLALATKRPEAFVSVDLSTAP